MNDATWAGRSASRPSPEEDDRRAGWVPAAGLVAALGLVVAGGYVLGSSDGTAATETAIAPTTTPIEVTTSEGTSPDDTVAAEATTTPSSEAPIEDSAAAPATSTTEATSSTGATTDTDADSTTEATTAGDNLAPDAGTPNQVIVEEGQVRGAVLRDGVLYLGGAVPSQEVAEQIIARAEAVVGAGNVISEYVIDPTVEIGHGAPLYVDDVVLFAYGSSTFDPAFEPLLDLGLALLSQNPSVTITIVTHTDASGSTTFNDHLSFHRGLSVARYWMERGIPAEQISIDARGEREPIADSHDPAGAQLNRRAEFFIEGLLP